MLHCIIAIYILTCDLGYETLVYPDLDYPPFFQT